MLRKLLKDSVSRKAHFFKFALNLGLDRARRLAGVPIREVARRMGVDEAMISRFPRIEANHTILSVAKYLEAIGADYEFIIRVKGKEIRVRPEAKGGLVVRDAEPMEYVRSSRPPRIRFEMKKSTGALPPSGEHRGERYGHSVPYSA